jgi:protein TonB
VFRGAVFSLLLHAVAVGVPYYFLIIRQPEAAVVELDLSPVAAPRAHAARARAAPPPPQAWAPAATTAAAVQAGAQAEPAADTACPPPCPDRPGEFVPAGLAVSAPRWIEGFITDDDYPPEARRLGLQGSVLLAVFILADGSVRDVRVVKGAYELLNRVALEKVRASRFTPATDDTGRAIPCKLMLPIRFELK